MGIFGDAHRGGPHTIAALKVSRQEALDFATVQVPFPFSLSLPLFPSSQMSNIE